MAWPAMACIIRQQNILRGTRRPARKTGRCLKTQRTPSLIRLFFALLQGSKALKNIGNQLPGEGARQPIDCRRILLDKRRQVRRGLVLLAEHVVVVLVENLPVAVIQRHRSLNRDKKAG